MGIFWAEIPIQHNRKTVKNKCFTTRVIGLQVLKIIQKFVSVKTKKDNGSDGKVKG